MGHNKTSDSYQVELILGWSHGQGSSSSFNSALVRPYHRLILEGKLIGNVNYVFLRQARGPILVIGALCRSSRGRTILFPGLQTRDLAWYTEGQRQLRPAAPGLLDHISLEKDLLSYHAKFVNPGGGEGPMISRRRTRVVRGYRYWCGLSIADINHLEVLPQEVRVVFGCQNEREAERRGRAFINARNNSVDYTISLPEGTPLGSSEFLHLDFYVASKLVDRTRLTCRPPSAPPAISTTLQRANRANVNGAAVAVKGLRRRVWVMASRQNGQLTTPAIISR